MSRKPLWPWALGSGAASFGLLHMEIIQERLEREFDLDLVTTAPSVSYHVILTNGEVVVVDNPTNLPDPSTIEYMEGASGRGFHHDSG